jgi:4-amino-4-deoxy-L-arabinose transferase-like glycosyltransferase
VLDVWLRCHAVGPALRERFGVDLYPATSAEPEPLDCDEAIYGYIGKRLARGAVMYRDLTENKPPGGYWLYAGAVALGGANELSIRLMPLPFVLATIVLVWWVGAKAGGPGTALLAVLVFSVVSTDPFLYGESANMEHMINLAAFGSLALLVAAWDRPGRRLVVASGVALGMAVLVKQTSALHVPVYALALLCRRQDASAPRRLRERGKDVLALAGGVVVVVAAAVGVMVVQGAGPAAFEDVVRYGRALATETPPPPNAPPWLVRWVTGNADPQGELPWPFGTTGYLVWWGTGTWPVWLAAVPGLALLGFWRHTGAAGRLVAAWTLSAWVQVALPGLFWQHYYLLPVPGLAVVIAALFTESLRRARSGPSGRVWYGLAALLVGVAVAWTIRLQVIEYLRVPPEDLVRDRGGRQWVVDRALGRELRRRSAVWDRPTLFVWGWQGPLYFYSGLDGVTRQVFVDDFMKNFAGSDHPQVRPRVERTIRELRDHPPSLIFTGYPPFPALKAFLEERYLPSRLAPGLWVERGRYGAFETFGGR